MTSNSEYNITNGKQLSNLETARMHYKRGMWNDAILLLEKYDLDNKSNKATEATILLAEMLIKQGILSRTEELLRKILKISSNKKLTADSHYQLGEIHFIKWSLMMEERLETSLEYHFMAKELREEIRDIRGLTSSLSRIGVIKERTGDVTEAKALFERSMELSNEMDVRSLIHLGGQAERDGDLDKAIKFYEKATKQSKKHSIEDYSFSLMNLGGALYKKGRKVEAKGMLTEALELADKMNHVIARGMFRFFLGRFHSEENDIEIAMKNFREIIEISEPLGLKRPVQMAKRELDTIAKKKG